jgi:hypothetical protein
MTIDPHYEHQETTTVIKRRKGRKHKEENMQEETQTDPPPIAAILLLAPTRLTPMTATPTEAKVVTLNTMMTEHTSPTISSHPSLPITKLEVNSREKLPTYIKNYLQQPKRTNWERLTQPEETLNNEKDTFGTGSGL